MRRVAILLLAIVVIGANDAGLSSRSTSCVGRCGENDYITGSCECNTVCQDYGDCCSDYQAICFTCQDRCGDPFVESAPCHCNNECGQHGNCCGDYSDLCDGGSTGSVTDQDLLTLSEELMNLDSNNVATQVTIDIQGKTTNSQSDDVAPNPLFTTVPSLTGSTFTLFEALRDNYEHAESVAEDITPEEEVEVSAFLDAVMATPLMGRLEAFMAEKQVLTGTLRDNIEEIWFSLYPRSGSTLGSSGFEHSFMGELDGSNIGGFHNWVSFYREEQLGTANYMGYIEYADLADKGYVFTNRYTWYDANKPIGGYFIGTSPEFELAVYTLCFFTRPGQQCHLQATNSVQYFIQTYEQTYGGKTLVATAYPGVL